MTPSIDIVIVNWNTGVHLRACVKSIANADRAGLTIGRISVVDNASSDGSLDNLDGGNLRVEVVRNPSNRGFSAACNQGAAGTTADYLLFLNPDTALYRDSLSGPIVYMEDADHADVGICGVRLLDDNGVQTTSCARFPSLKTFTGEALGLSRIWPQMFRPHLLSADECQVTRDVEQIIGAFFLVRRTVFEALHGFDERFFVYYEEVDFAFRARQSGFRSVYLADVSVYHRGGLSSDQVKAARLFYSLRSRLQYGFKHFSRIEAVALVAVTLGIECVARLARSVARGSVADVQEVIAGYLALWRHFWQQARSIRYNSRAI